MADVIFSLDAMVAPYVSSMRKASAETRVLSQATDAQKRAFARAENKSMTAAAALGKLAKANATQATAARRATQYMGGHTRAADANARALARADAEINDLTRSTCCLLYTSPSPRDS